MKTSYLLAIITVSSVLGAVTSHKTAKTAFAVVSALAGGYGLLRMLH
jgi:hypothetical protein